MSEWIKCSEKMPLEKTGFFSCIAVLVSDGVSVGVCECISGDLPKPWVAFSSYGDVNGNDITHWQPLPPPPEEA